ncbi:MAG TPA: hypothetical protein VFW29_12110 [Solirubrobacteraceae bacterium]|nr:hypothetical protein [Solirubrobacteraceae bacterium]
MSRTARRATLVVAGALSLLATLGAPANAARATVLDAKGFGVSAYGGWAAWTHEEPPGVGFALYVRSPAGAVAAAPVPLNGGSFEVKLGPRAGGVSAVYQRCSEPARSLGCTIYELPLGIPTASERALAIPDGGSDTQPAIWGDRVAFVRANAGNAKHPDTVYVWRIGGGAPRAIRLQASLGGREAHGGRWPKGLTGEVTALTIGPSQVAYVTSVLDGSFGETTLWYEPLGSRPQLIDQETGGAGGVCPPSFLSPMLAGGWLYAYLHACAPSDNPELDRLTRYRRGGAERARFTFAHHGDDAIGSVVIDGAGADWDDEGLSTLAPLSWKRIALPVAQTFCTRADPFC